MAYSSVRVQFELGHEASVRTKKTPEGFTHDWEVFVRGADNTDIQCFVDKVVFHLHETFPKPRRVIKEPPYIVKESGYAGFVLPIDVYLKNKEEPKKISFQYDLTLQTSGPPISRVLREPRLFQNPSEDFRRKLIRGGGVGVDTPSDSVADDLKPAPSISQPKTKPAESPAKKHKSDQPLNHSFAELFGTPIRRVLEQKKSVEPPKKIDEKKKSSKPYREEKEATKDKYLDRDKSKERMKRPPSPTFPPPPAPQSKSKEEHKKHDEKDKKKDEEKRKRKEEREKKEKAKEPERQPERESKKEKKESRDGDYAKKLNSKPPDAKINYERHNNDVVDRDKERLEREKHKHRHKKKEKEKNRDKEKHRKDKEKEKDFREKEKEKEREKEKEKSIKKKQEETREKEEKRRKSRTPSPPVQVKKGPLNALLDELGSSDSASPLSDEDSISPGKPFPKPPTKTVPEMKPMPMTNTTVSKPKSTNDSTSKLEETNSTKTKKEKSSSKKSKKLDRDLEKKKEKQEPRARSVSSEPVERDEEEEDEDEEEKEKEKEKEKALREERLEKERTELEEKTKTKDKENRKRKREKEEEKQAKSKKSEASLGGGTEVTDEGGGEEFRKPDKFTKEYVAQLRDLQHRIMTLEDNAELQKVVKVIAETGQYEVTKKTFDFDLCALDMETVKRLQEFFAPT